MITRRRFALMAAGAAGTEMLSGCLRHQTTQAPLPAGPDWEGFGSLKAHAAARGFLYGCAVNAQHLVSDPPYAELVRAQASIVVAENAMKWALLRPAPDQFAFEPADQLLQFAEANAMKVRGHNLCWHHQLPRWFAAEANQTNARSLLIDHIERVVSRYAGRMHSWDVVNEAILVSDGRPDGLRDSPWLRLIGEDYIELAFRTARDADPQAVLTYNEYGIEAEDTASAAKRVAVLTLLRRLRARHVPLDAVGVQSHIEAGESYGAGMREFLRALREMGLQIFITEMDVNDRALPAGIDVRDHAVGDVYANYLDLVLAEPAVRAVLTWGITDRLTWLNAENARTDKLPERCLPFDLDDKPTPAFFAMRKSFDQRTVSRAG